MHVIEATEGPQETSMASAPFPFGTRAARRIASLG